MSALVMSALVMSALVMSAAESAESAKSAESAAFLLKTTDSLSFSNPKKELTSQSKHLSLTRQAKV